MQPQEKFSILLATFSFNPGASSSESSVVKKRKRDFEESPSKRAKRDVSELPPLQDRLEKYLDVIICGCNPGYTSALVGFHYGNTQNAFWRCLHRSGLTPRLLQPSEGPSLPELYGIGLTDLVVRPSHSFSDIPGQERKQSVLALLQRIAYYKPRILALNSFTIWSDIASQLAKKEGLAGVTFKAPAGSAKPSFKLPQVERNREPCFLPWKFVYTDDSESRFTETLIIPMPGTSGANASYSLAEKVAFFKLIHDTLPRIKEGTFDTSHMGEIIVQIPQTFVVEPQTKLEE